MSIIYGIDGQSEADAYLATAEKVVEALCEAAVPGAFLVDFIPILKYVPKWVPGAGFQRKAHEWKKIVTHMVNDPFEATKKALADGTAPPSLVARALQDIGEGEHKKNDAEDIIKAASASLFGAAFDTIVSVVSSCILGLLEHPEVLAKAQKELDLIVQPGNLPDFKDRPFLPYITAIVKETMRWRHVAPLSMPHRLSVEDEYKGYRLPAGSLIIPNVWAMLHDETVYPDPFEFNPDRFIDKDGKLNLKNQPDPSRVVWGFGRRICPGRFLAFSELWLTIASLIYVFDFEKARDDKGDIIELTHEYTQGVALFPKPYKCVIKPRSKEMEDLV